MRKLLPNQTKIAFNIGQGLDTGTALIVDNKTEDGKLLYKLQILTGSPSDLHRDGKGDLWVNDFEVRPTSQP